TIRGLAARGVDMLVLHGYKGLGLEFEKQELDRTRRAAALCRQHGLKVGLYCQVATLFPETFFRCYPQGRDWIQRGHDGQPCYYNTQTFRVFPCFRNRGYLEYYKEVVRFLLQDIGANFLHFDNLVESVEPHSCHCSHCRRAFTAFLYRRYGGDAHRALRVQRFGFDDLDALEPPVYSPWLHPRDAEIINDPLQQEWNWFRCETIADFITEVSAFAASLNPQAGVEANVGYFPGPNRIRASCTFVPWFAHAVDLVFNEDPNGLPRVTEDGVVATNIRAFKIARGQGIGCFGGGARSTPEDIERTAAERLAFSPDFSWWMGSPAAIASEEGRPELPYLDFYRANRGLYHDAQVISCVALLRSFPTLANNAFRPNLIACVLEQSLIESRIPWTCVADSALHEFPGFRILVMPEVECVGEPTAERIAAFVNNGGGLLLTGDTSRFDEWRRPWPQPVLARLFGLKDWPAKTQMWEHGFGRVAYIPDVRLRAPAPIPAKGGPGFTVPPDLWRAPANHREIVQALLWTARGRFSVQAAAPRGVCCEYTRQTGRVIVHFANFRDKPIPRAFIRFARSLSGDAHTIRFLSPELPEPVTRPLNVKPSSSSVQTPPFRRYLAAVLDTAK
ncbi:MAG TPA: hypothetical protein P5137_15720, partial [Candidatus Brocadiia bacterium]|nr:hypothetical protein [Candidatus Brocadiia bacterium]